MMTAKYLLLGFLLPANFLLMAWSVVILNNRRFVKEYVIANILQCLFVLFASIFFIYG